MRLPQLKAKRGHEESGHNLDHHFQSKVFPLLKKALFTPSPASGMTKRPDYRSLPKGNITTVCVTGTTTRTLLQLQSSPADSTLGFTPTSSQVGAPASLHSAQHRQHIQPASTPETQAGRPGLEKQHHELALCSLSEDHSDLCTHWMIEAPNEEGEKGGGRGCSSCHLTNRSTAEYTWVLGGNYSGYT